MTELVTKGVFFKQTKKSNKRGIIIGDTKMKDDIKCGM